MKKLKTLPIILILMFLLVLTSIYLTAQSSSDINPDDFVQEFVGELNAPGFIGNYYTNPSFKIQVDYDISDYEFIKTKAQEIINLCNENPEPTKCVTDSLRLLNSEKNNWNWSFNCDQGAEKLFNNLVDFITECKQSIDDNCTCTMDDFDEESEAYLTQNKPEILLAEERIRDVINNDYSNNIKIIQSKPAGQEHTIEEVSLNYFSNDEQIGFDSVSYRPKKNNINLEFHYQLAGTSKKWDEDTITLFNNNSKLTFIKEDDADKFNIYPSCKPIKKFHRICAKNNKFNFTIYNKKTNKTESKQATYKFALFFEDTTPPPKITGLKLVDTNLSENNITIKWDASPAPDAKEYTIYFSETPFTDISQAEKIATIPHKKTATLYNTTIKVEEDKKTYYFAVTAKDHNKNEDSEVESKEGMSKDDLPPGPVGYPSPIIPITKISDTPYKIQLNWQRPTKNIDGSDIQETEDEISYNIYYYTPPTPDKELTYLDIPPPITNLKTTTQIIEGLEPLKTYYFAVIAVDEEGNPDQKFLNKVNLQEIQHIDENPYKFEQISYP